MRILAVIPARGQSKRLPGKNIRALGGKPLIVWTIEAALGVPHVCDILVSTDDSAIAAVATTAGAMVPWLRPAELATDTARAVDVALHATDWYEHTHAPIDGLLLLQPTSPFRTCATICAGIEAFERYQRRAVVAVSPADAHPMWAFRIDAGCLVPFMKDHGLQTRSQDLPACYTVNGCLYLISPQDLRATESFFPPTTTPLVIESPREQLDIDDDWHWQFAEWLVQSPNVI